MLRRYFTAQIEEIRADPALRLYGAMLGVGQVLTFATWTGWQTVWHLSNRGEPICWPLFEQCFRYRVLTFEQVTAVLLAYGALSVVSAVLFLLPRRAAAAYLWLVLVNLVKTAIYVQEYRLRMNQHYMLYMATLVFLFLPNKRHLLRYTLVFFYVWASTLKYNAEWLGGHALYHDPLLVPKALIPASCAYVVFLESFIVWGVLSGRRWLMWTSFAQLILFHIISWPVVGFFYPLLMFALLTIFPLTVRHPQAGEPPSLLRALWSGRQPRSTYAFLAFFSLLQLVPVAMPGDEKITGEGRLFSLHMFDSRIFCKGALTLKFKDGTIQEQPIPFRWTTRIRCDPAANFSRAKRLCHEHRNDPNFVDLDLVYEARRAHQKTKRPLVSITDFCRQDLSYSIWRPNEWILKDKGTFLSASVSSRSALRNVPERID
jgi:hypothetical protein